MTEAPQTSYPVSWHGRPARGLLVFVLSAVCSFVLAGCSGEKKELEAIAKTAATNRAGAATALRNGFYAKTITLDGAIDMAHERVNPDPKPGTPARTPTAGEVAFAGAVLDFVDQIEPDIKAKVLNDFFWIRLGTLAGNAAAAARGMNDLQLARSVVLAGPKGWKTEVYWRQCPAHDALASIILFESGEGKEALDRLRDRPELPDEVAAAKAMIEKEMKKRPRK